MSLEIWISLLGGFCTIGIFTFLWRENAFYRMLEHFFIGIAVGYGPVLVTKEFLWPKVLAPLLGLNRVVFPDGSYEEPYNYWYLLFALALLFGSLYYFIFSRRLSWLAKIVIGFSIGATAGLGFRGWFAEMIPQFSSSMKPLVVFEEGKAIDWITSLGNIAFVFTLVSVMTYFFFSFKSESKMVKGLSSSGRWMMMICFGAFFGSTVMGRMALLVERVQFLLGDWWSAVRVVVG